MVVILSFCIDSNIIKLKVSKIKVSNFKSTLFYLALSVDASIFHQNTY